MDIHLPGPVQSAVDHVEHAVESGATTIKNDVESAATTVENKIQTTAADVRAQVTAARPDVAIANLSAEAVAKLPAPMRAWLGGLPNIGTIGDEVGVGKPAVISSPEFGESSAAPTILDVPVSAKQQGLLDVGVKVHQKFWQDAPPFNFNVNFSCAKTDPLTGTSDYADPRSPWNNVFFGRYEIDCPAGKPGEKDKWQRPFGFTVL